MDPAHVEMPTAELARVTDPAGLGFETTVELSDLNDVIAQERAIEPLRSGGGMRAHRYNFFVLGSSGYGLRRIVSQLLTPEAAKRPISHHGGYIQNFADPHRPKALRLPLGRGSAFKTDMVNRIKALRAAIPGAFESEDYTARRRAFDEELLGAGADIVLEPFQHAADRAVELLCGAPEEDRTEIPLIEAEQKPGS